MSRYLLKYPTDLDYIDEENNIIYYIALKDNGGYIVAATVAPKVHMNEINSNRYYTLSVLISIATYDTKYIECCINAGGLPR